jgi:hypothetical protein
VGFFVTLWIASASDPRSFNERDALLPLEPDANDFFSSQNKHS